MNLKPSITQICQLKQILTLTSALATINSARLQLREHLMNCPVLPAAPLTLPVPPLQVPAPSPSFLKCSPVITALLVGSRSSWAGDGLVRWHFHGYGQASWDVPSRAGQVPWFPTLLEGKRGQRKTSDSLGIRD